MTVHREAKQHPSPESRTRTWWRESLVCRGVVQAAVGEKVADKTAFDASVGGAVCGVNGDACD
jgi:hypothetical protein